MLEIQSAQYDPIGIISVAKNNPWKCFLATEYTEKHGRIQKDKEKFLLIFLRDFHS